MQSQTEQNIFSTKHTERSALYRKPVGDNSLILTNYTNGGTGLAIAWSGSPSLSGQIFLWMERGIHSSVVRLGWGETSARVWEGARVVYWSADPCRACYDMEWTLGLTRPRVRSTLWPHLYSSIAWRGRSLCETNYSCYNRTGQLSKSIKMVS